MSLLPIRRSVGHIVKVYYELRDDRELVKLLFVPALVWIAEPMVRMCLIYNVIC